jgi:hypothetical protein
MGTAHRFIYALFIAESNSLAYVGNNRFQKGDDPYKFIFLVQCEYQSYFEDLQDEIYNHNRN